MHLVWILPRLLLKFLPKQTRPWFHTASYANICIFISSGCGKHIYNIESCIFCILTWKFLSFSLIHESNTYILFCCVITPHQKRKTGVRVKFKHEIDICSAIGMILQVYKCWENSGRKIVVVN